MKFFIDLSKKQLIKSAASNVAHERLVLKRRDSLAIEVVFVSRNAVATMPAGTTTTVALKKTFADSNVLALASGEPPTLNLNTVPLEATFSSNPATVPALLEIRWSVPGETTRTATLSVEIQNSVILGTEATPAAIPDGKATQAEATTGTDNTKWMTPLRTAQAIEALAEPAYFGTTQPPAGSNYKFWVNTSTGRQFALIGGQWLETSGSSTGALGGTGGGGVTSYNDLTDKPTLGTAAATAASNYATAAQGAKADSASQPGHQHGIADTTGLQAALDAKQPAGSYAPATGIAPSAVTGTAVITTDHRLSDSRAPLSHQHAISDVTNLSTSLAEKISGTGVASMQVVTSLPASPTPTTFYIVIPSGATTASAVTLGSVSLFTGTGGDGGGGGGDPQPTLWTPLGMTGLQRWYDAAEDSSITSSGGKVSQWLDKSGNSRHATQATAANQPTYFSSDAFGRKSIGNTTAAGLLGLDCPSTTYKEIFIVGYYGTGTESVFSGISTFFAGPGANNAQRVAGNNAVNAFLTTSAFTSSVFKNASGESTTAPLPIPPSILRFNAAAAVTQQTFLFYSSLSTSRSFRGAFSEVLFFAADLDATNRQKVEGYFAHKWALAGNLPADHPYKSAAPTA